MELAKDPALPDSVGEEVSAHHGRAAAARALTVGHTSAAWSPMSVCPVHWEAPQDTPVPHLTPDTGGGADVPEAP